MKAPSQAVRAHADTAWSSTTSRGIGERLRGHYRAWRRHRAIVRNAAQLRRLGGRTLNDLGLHRSGVYAAAMSAYDAAEPTGQLDA